MDTADKNDGPSYPTENSVNVPSSSSPNPIDQTCTAVNCDKLKDDLKLFTSGRLYDVTFKISSDVTGESKVIQIIFPK